MMSTVWAGRQAELTCHGGVRASPGRVAMAGMMATAEMQRASEMSNIRLGVTAAIGKASPVVVSNGLFSWTTVASQPCCCGWHLH